MRFTLSKHTINSKSHLDLFIDINKEKLLHFRAKVGDPTQIWFTMGTPHRRKYLDYSGLIVGKGYIQVLEQGYLLTNHPKWSTIEKLKLKKAPEDLDAFAYEIQDWR